MIIQIVPLWRVVKTKIIVKKLCDVLELSLSIFYRWLQRTERLRDKIEEKIKDVCLRCKLGYRYRRITTILWKMGLCVNSRKIKPPAS